MAEFVGIVNVTPDSFSDGGAYFDPDKAIKRARSLISEGASIIDIGAESTRPDAIAISHEEEWERLYPVLNELQDIRISVDTRHHETAIKAIDLGVQWINDVSGFSDIRMINAVKDSNVKLVAMHNIGVPANPNNVISGDPVDVVQKWLKKKINTLVNHGISKDRIIFDPGIGFGKTAEQSLELIKNISCFQGLGVKILVGHSEKSFLSLFTDKQAGERDIETFLVSAYLSSSVNYLRVHDVEGNIRAVNVSEVL